MYLSLNWIKRFIKEDFQIDPNQLQELVSTKVAELEGFESQQDSLKNIIVAEIKSLSPHPNADKLTICQVNIGSEEVQIVCGGTNLKEGMLTVVALPGSQVRWHGEGDLITLEATKLRGEYSHGMICTSDEIGLGKPEDDSHIMDLSGQPFKPGQPLSESLNLNDVIFEIDNKSITNRPDLWGHKGFAREIATITNTNFQTPKLPEIKTEEKAIPYTLKNHQEEICQRFSSLLIENIKVQESPDHIKEDLLKVGLKPINSIVDILNHTMLELGQPMHAYDYDKIKSIANSDSPELNIQYASKSKFTGIDQQEYQLDSNIPVLTTGETAICILGVMGGQNTEVDSNTTSILIESATFKDSVVRKASQKLGLRSDSSQRFEKALDPNQTLEAIQKVVSLIKASNPEAKLTYALDDQYYTPLTSPSIDLRISKVNSYLGTDLDSKEIQEILNNLQFQTEHKDDIIKVKVPTFRASKDISIEQDLIEEVGRIYGYDKIPTHLPELQSTSPTENSLRKQENQTRIHLQALGLSETHNYSFYSEKDIENTHIQENHIKVKNFLSEEQTHMRTHLLPNLLKNIHQNYKNNPSISLFEIGRTYHETSEFFPAEEEKLAMIHADSSKEQNHETYYEVKGWTESLLEKFGIQNYKFQKIQEPADFMHPHIAAEIKTKDGQTIGQIYRIHPNIIKNYGIKSTKASFAEINLGMLLHLSQPTTIFQEIPKFPDMEFDLSVIVDDETTHQEISETLENASKQIIKVELFDVFQDEEKVGKGKKACAYRMTIRSLERTLTDQDLAKAQKESIQALEKIGGVVRTN